MGTLKTCTIYTNAQRGGMDSNPSPRGVENIPPRSISIGLGPYTVFALGKMKVCLCLNRNGCLTIAAKRPVVRLRPTIPPQLGVQNELTSFNSTPTVI